MPHVGERARGLGIEAYLATLGSSEANTYDAQGNAFDYRALALRVGHWVRVWLAGGALPATAWPGGAELARLFQDIRDGLPAALGRWPAPPSRRTWRRPWPRGPPQAAIP